MLGNWGTNSKFKASEKSPMRMYYSDFDENGNTETIVAIEKNGEYFPIQGLDALSGQLVYLKKKFSTYSDFAGKTMVQILNKKNLDKAKILEVNELRSGYLENNKGGYTFVPFQTILQTAPITALLCYDFDSDGKKEILAAGNYFGVEPYHGRFGSFSGAMIKGKNNVILGHEMGLDLTQKSARNLNIITLNNQPYLLVTFNNERAQVYELINKIAE
jgi:hypothetical protein